MDITRTKVEALKALGEKVTGKTIDIDENETIVSMVDKITENYEGGTTPTPTPTPTQRNFIRIKTEPPEGTSSKRITDEDDIAVLDAMYDEIKDDLTKYPDGMILIAYDDYQPIYLTGYIEKDLGIGSFTIAFVQNSDMPLTISRYVDDNVRHWDIL